MADFFSYLTSNWQIILRLTLWHLGIVFLSGGVAIAIALPAGIFVTRPNWRIHSNTILATANVFQTVPSLAVIGLASAVLAIIGLGIGWAPAILALVLYSILPVLSNTIVGLDSIDHAVIRAARGMGMAPHQILFGIELPLAIPTIFAGIRTSIVINVGTAALAAAIGAECLGSLIFQGISTGNLSLLLAGAIPTALLAILIDALFALLEHKLGSPGLRGQT